MDTIHFLWFVVLSSIQLILGTLVGFLSVGSLSSHILTNSGWLVALIIALSTTTGVSFPLLFTREFIPFIKTFSVSLFSIIFFLFFNFQSWFTYIPIASLVATFISAYILFSNDMTKIYHFKSHFNKIRIIYIFVLALSLFTLLNYYLNNQKLDNYINDELKTTFLNMKYYVDLPQNSLYYTFQKSTSFFGSTFKHAGDSLALLIYEFFCFVLSIFSVLGRFLFGCIDPIFVAIVPYIKLLKSSNYDTQRSQSQEPILTTTTKPPETNIEDLNVPKICMIDLRNYKSPDGNDKFVNLLVQEWCYFKQLIEKNELLVDPYALLRFSPEHGIRMLSLHYNSLSRRWDPDRFELETPENRDFARKIYKFINLAYEQVMAYQNNVNGYENVKLKRIDF